MAKSSKSKKNSSHDGPLLIHANSTSNKSNEHDHSNGNSDHGEDTTAAVSSKMISDVLHILSSITERVEEVNSMIPKMDENICSYISDVYNNKDDLVDYLDVKQQVLLSYCLNLVYYLYMKVDGQSTRDHPIMRELLELRYIVEKMKPLDGKMKYQIDRLLSYSSLPSEEAKTLSLRPNISGFGLDDDSDDDNSDASTDADSDTGGNNNDNDSDNDSDDDNEEDKYNSKGSIYKPPKIAAMPFKEVESQAIKHEKLMLKKRNKLKHSEMLDVLRAEFSHAPELSSSTGVSNTSSDHKKLKAEADERRNFEEDRMIRTQMSRKEKIDIKRRSTQANRLDNFDSLGDIGDMQELSNLIHKDSGASGNRRSSSGSGSKRGADTSSSDAQTKKKKKAIDTAGALTKAMQLFEKSNTDMKKHKK